MINGFELPLTVSTYEYIDFPNEARPRDAVGPGQEDAWILQHPDLENHILTVVKQYVDLPDCAFVTDLFGSSVFTGYDYEVEGEIFFGISCGGKSTLRFSGTWQGTVENDQLKIWEVWIDEGFGQLTTNGEILLDLGDF